STSETNAKRKYRGENAAQRRARRDQQFIEAAKVVFGDHGFQATKMRQICAEAGLTERYYYESFGSLNDLFEAVYFRELDTLRAALDEATKNANSDPASMAKALVTAYYQLLDEDRRLARILIVDIYSAAPNIPGLYRRGIKEFADRFGLLVAQGQSDVNDQPLDASLIATALIGTASSLAMRWILGGYRESRETISAHCLAVFMAVIQMNDSAQIRNSIVLN
ncbi:MAG: AcrR family transcriptional regulator, partial [Gammaproteobacteria bacterium]